MKSIEYYFNINLNISKDKEINQSNLTEGAVNAIKSFKEELAKKFNEAGSDFENFVDKIWSCGPRKCGSNLLINNTSDYKRSSLWSSINRNSEQEEGSISFDKRNEYDSSFINGFQMATLSGPLCEEPMQGVCFIIKEWNILENDSSGSTQPYGPISGKLLQMYIYL